MTRNYHSSSSDNASRAARGINRQVKVTAPATIWGQQVLAQRKDRPTNDFEAKAVLAYLRACGVAGVTYCTAFKDLDAIHTFKL